MTNIIKKFGKEKRWVNWKLETVAGEEKKIPITLAGQPASSTNPETWSVYDDAKKVSDNIGIVFTPDKKLLGIDIDHCLSGGEIIHEEREKITTLLSKANTYTEISPSKNGLHLFLSITEALPLMAKRKGSFEVYTSGRYFTVTSLVFGEEKPVRTVTPKEALGLISIIGYPWGKNKLKQQPLVTDDYPTKQSTNNDIVILEKMFLSKNGAQIKSLYNGDISAYDNDDSSADMALCAHLAFWTGKNALQMERIWLDSPLGSREKTRSRIDYRNTTISKAIADCKEAYSPTHINKNLKSLKEERRTQSDQLLKIIDQQNTIKFFHDEEKNAYLSFEVDGHQEIWPCKTRAVKLWLSHEFWKATTRAIGQENLKNVLAVIESRAIYDGPMHELSNRVGWKDRDLWYDLTNKNWQAVKINETGWDVVDKPPILFKRYVHHSPQVTPGKNGNAKLFLKYVNITDIQQQLLLMVFMISCFIPDFAHVILVIFGSQGSAKSTLSKLLRLVIDPSIINVVSMPEQHKELVQALAHHSFLIFDNVSYLSENNSDILCKASTGSGFVKRELYSNDEDIIYKIRRCIGINGINLVGTRPDLLERSLLLELDRIEKQNRKQEELIMNDFKCDLPLILGGIFDVVAVAIKLKNTIKVKELPRMADFALWGCAIAEALGHKKEEFLDAYQANIDNQTEIILNENIIASTIISFMKDKSEWRGTASVLLHELTINAFGEMMDTHEKGWPKGPNVLMRKLRELKVNLKEAGIIFESIPNGIIREVTLRNIKAREREKQKNAVPLNFNGTDNIDG